MERHVEPVYLDFLAYPAELQAVDAYDGPIAEGRYSEARGTLDLFLREHPDDPAGLLVLARYYRAKGNRRRAEEVARRVRRGQPGNINALEVLAEGLVERSDYTGAQALILEAQRLWSALPGRIRDRIAERGPEEWFLYLQWRIYDATGRHRQAATLARSVISSGRGHLNWKHHLLDSLLALGQFQEAERVYPEHYLGAVWDIAHLLAGDRRYTDAMPFFLRAISFARLPQQIWYLTAYLECLLLGGQERECIRLCEFWLTDKSIRYSRRWHMQALLALAYAARGDNDRAAELAADIVQGSTPNKRLRQIREHVDFYDNMMPRLLDLFALQVEVTPPPTRPRT